MIHAKGKSGWNRLSYASKRSWGFSLKNLRYTMVFVGLLGLSGVWASGAQKTGASGSAEDTRIAIEGVWRGHSVCEDKGSSCHDELNVYRFSKVAGKANTFLVTASKVVDGREIVIGSSEWKYEEGKKTLESEQPPIRMMIDGKKMDGALRLADGTVYRRIYLTKAN